MSRKERPVAVCPCTSLAIPECSCRRCLEEQIRRFSPLVRSGGLSAPPPLMGARAEDEDGRAAA